MEKEAENRLVYRTSLIQYLTNYVIVILILIILFLISPQLNVFGNLLHLALFFGILAIAAGFAEEPFWHIYFKKYVITSHEIKKLEGILNKKETIIPYQSVADVRVVKTFFDRILGIGTVHVRGFKEGGDIVMNGIRKPEEIQRIIQNKINLVRETTLKAWKK